MESFARAFLAMVAGFGWSYFAFLFLMYIFGYRIKNFSHVLIYVPVSCALVLIYAATRQVLGGNFMVNLTMEGTYLDFIVLGALPVISWIVCSLLTRSITKRNPSRLSEKP